MTNKPITIICGPTAAGKTTLALDLASKEPTTIISADSRQAYKHLTIVTGKDIPPGFKPSFDKFPFYQSSKIRLFGYDLLEPDQESNLAQFVRFAYQLINSEQALGQNIIVVGGTGLYLRGLTEPKPPMFVPKNLNLRHQLESEDLLELQNKLKAISPLLFSQLNNSDRNNKTRLIRKIEIESYTGDSNADFPKQKFKWFGKTLPIEILEKRINERVQQRIEQGAVNEVKTLLSSWPDRTLPIYRTLGTNQIIKFLDGQIDQSQLIQLWTQAERQYAKRQLTWFKAIPNINWY